MMESRSQKNDHKHIGASKDGQVGGRKIKMKRKERVFKKRAEAYVLFYYFFDNCVTACLHRQVDKSSFGRLTDKTYILRCWCRLPHGA